jgi:hypothetical protein
MNQQKESIKTAVVAEQFSSEYPAYQRGWTTAPVTRAAQRRLNQ